MPDETIVADQPAESSTAAPASAQSETPAEPQYKALDAFTSDEHDEWLKTGKRPELKSAGDKTPETSAASEAGNQPGAQTQEQPESHTPKDRSAEGRKQQLGREIAEKLRERKALNDQYEQERQRKEALALEIEGLQKQRDDIKAASSTAPAPNADLKPPKWSDYDTEEAFQAANQKFYDAVTQRERAETDKRIKDAIALDRTERLKTDEQRKAAETHEQNLKTWEQRFEEGQKRHSDFVDVAMNQDLQVSKSMDKWLLKQELGGEILYRLGKDFAEGGTLAKTISGMDHDEAIEAMVTIKKEIASEIERAKKPVLPRAAGKPPANLAGPSEPSVDPVKTARDAGKYEEYSRAQNQRDLEAFRARQ